jgi:hypothetical protein
LLNFKTNPTQGDCGIYNNHIIGGSSNSWIQRELDQHDFIFFVLLALIKQFFGFVAKKTDDTQLNLLAFAKGSCLKY